MDVPQKLKKYVHENVQKFASKQEEIILNVYQQVFSKIPGDIPEEQQNSIIQNVFKDLFSVFDKSIDEQKKAAKEFFKDSSNVDSVIKAVREEAAENGNK